MAISQHQQKVIDGLPEHKKEFIKKQLTCFEGWMQGDMFMPCDGYCYYCRFDVIKLEIDKGNDGSKGVTGCSNCHRSYCD